MYRLIASIALVLALPAFAQPTCTPATTTQNAARDEARLSWIPPVTYVDGGTISSPITYKVSRATGAGSFAVQCQTTAVTVSLLAQPLGVQNYRVTATVAGVESAPSNVASKTIVAPTPNPPGNLTLLEQLVAFVKRLFGWFA